MYFWKTYPFPSRDWSATNDWFEKAFEPFAPANQYSPHSEIGQTDTHYWLSVDLPGVAKEDIQVEAKGDELTISGERKGFGKFSKTFELNAPVDLEKVETLHKDGVLKVAIPKADSAKPRLISVKTEDEGGVFKKLLNQSDETKKVN